MRKPIAALVAASSFLGILGATAAHAEGTCGGKSGPELIACQQKEYADSQAAVPQVEITPLTVDQIKAEGGYLIEGDGRWVVYGVTTPDERRAYISFMATYGSVLPFTNADGVIVGFFPSNRTTFHRLFDGIADFDARRVQAIAWGNQIASGHGGAVVFVYQAD